MTVQSLVMHATPLTTRHRLSLVTALLAALVIAGCAPTTTTATLSAADDRAPRVPGWNGVAMDGTPTMPDQAFTAADGQPFDLRAAMRERPTLVYFGYTHCPDICPVHMATIAAALDDRHIRPDQLNVVFVTVDPRRDTPDVLADYMAAFDPSFEGLWAPQDEIDRVVTGLGLPAPVVEGDEGDGQYTMGHPSHVIAFDTQGRARLAYPFGTRQSEWAEDLPKLVQEEWS